MLIVNIYSYRLGSWLDLYTAHLFSSCFKVGCFCLWVLVVIRKLTNIIIIILSYQHIYFNRNTICQLNSYNDNSYRTELTFNPVRHQARPVSEWLGCSLLNWEIRFLFRRRVKLMMYNININLFFTRHPVILDMTLNTEALCRGGRWHYNLKNPHCYDSDRHT